MASKGHLYGAIVATENCGNIEGWVFPVFMGQQIFTQPHMILHYSNTEVLISPH